MLAVTALQDAIKLWFGQLMVQNVDSVSNIVICCTVLRLV
jgi:hypothetical protein